MTITLPVTTKIIQHYHFHNGEEEGSRGLRNVAILGPPSPFGDEIRRYHLWRSPRISAWNKWQKSKYHRFGNRFAWTMGYNQHQNQQKSRRDRLNRERHNHILWDSRYRNYKWQQRRGLNEDKHNSFSAEQLQELSKHRKHNAHAWGRDFGSLTMSVGK